jgi:hypothetical protein
LGLQKQRDQSTGIDQEPRISRSGGSGSKNNPEEQGAAEARIPRKQQGSRAGRRGDLIIPGDKNKQKGSFREIGSEFFFTKNREDAWRSGAGGEN